MLGPNIIGSFGVWSTFRDPSGAFTVYDEVDEVQIARQKDALTCKRRTLQFKASDVNGIYGNISTVTPPSLVLNYVIKY